MADEKIAGFLRELNRGLNGEPENKKAILQSIVDEIRKPNNDLLKDARFSNLAVTIEDKLDQNNPDVGAIYNETLNTLTKMQGGRRRRGKKSRKPRGSRASRKAKRYTRRR